METLRVFGMQGSGGRPLVAVGEANWNIHESSRRHRKQLAYNERKRTHDEVVAKYKKIKEEREALKAESDVS